MLDKIIHGESLAWDKTLENNREKFLINLKVETINELIKKRSKLIDLNIEDFFLLKNEILSLRKTLIDGYGFFVINGLSLDSFSKTEQKSIFILSSKILGELLVQNIKQEKLVEIKNEGKSMKSGGRYHQTKEGGSYHTDSPQWKEVPDYVGLFCIKPAKKGGISKFLSVYSIHNKLLKEQKDLLEILYDKFHFDKRGEYKNGESPTTFEQIFEYKNGKLNFRYLRDYIDGGHNIQNKSLSNLQKASLDYLDKKLQDDDITLSYELKEGDMIFFNNHRIVHGRTSFEDYNEDSLKRFLIRVWIKDTNY